MLIDGIKLMVVGMLTVFTFLVLLVIIISASSKVLAPFAGLLDKPEQQKSGGTRKTKSGAKSDDSSMIAAIISAVHQFRRDNGEE